jgi:hypothetical protein
MARHKKQRQEPTVQVAWNSPTTVDDYFAASVIENAINDRRIKSVNVGSGARINRVRNQLIRNFLASPFDYLWMVDTDMVIPPHAITELLKTARSQKRRLVSGLAYMYRPQDDPVLLPSIVHYLPDGSDTFVVNKPPTERFVECDATGFFCLLIHRSVLEEMQAYWGEGGKGYNNPWIDELERGPGPPVGPDMEFFERAKEATGETPLIDTSVSCGHLKRVHLSHRDAVRAWNLINPGEQI